MGVNAKAFILIVRRGALRRFDRLKRDVAGLPVDVIWDRRTETRRAQVAKRKVDQRRSERRKQSQFTWDVADFIVLQREVPKT
jgi:hypothetical protein